MGDFGDDNGGKNDNNKDAEVTWDEFVPSLDSPPPRSPGRRILIPFSVVTVKEMGGRKIFTAQI